MTDLRCAAIRRVFKLESLMLAVGIVLLSAGVANAASTPVKYQLPANMVVQLAKLTASDGMMSFSPWGHQVAISGDTVVATGENEAYVFVKPATGWADMTETAKLTFSDGAAGDYVNSVAIYGDVIVVGTPQNYPYDGSGAAYIFVKPVTGWTSMTETVKLTNSDAAALDQFGSAVVLSADTLVVGAPGAFDTRNTTAGAAYVFVKPSAGWSPMTETAKLTASDGIPGGLAGYALAVQGQTIAVGAMQGGPTLLPGRVYIFVEPSSGWTNMTETAKLTASDGVSNDTLGCSVAIAGNTLVAGSFNATVRGHAWVGAAYIFVAPPGGWISMTETAKLTAPGPHYYAGNSVALQGRRLLVGAPNVIGSNVLPEAFVYLKPAAGWQTTSMFNSKLTGSDEVLGDRFADSVSLDGDTIAISGTTLGVNGVYIFGRTP